MVGLQSLDLPIGVRIPVSQFKFSGKLLKFSREKFFSFKIQTINNSNSLFMDWHETEIRVRYAETDKMGIVHHSNYLVWFELGEANFAARAVFPIAKWKKKKRADGRRRSLLSLQIARYYEDVLTFARVSKNFAAAPCDSFMKFFALG
jgi:hypothetical protein